MTRLGAWLASKGKVVISRLVEESGTTKPLGAYLIEAGIVTPEQVKIALKQQTHSGKRLGTLLAACGWVKQQTIEYLIEKIVLPQRTAN